MTKEVKKNNLSNRKIRHHAEKVMVMIAVIYVTLVILSVVFLLVAGALGITELDAGTTNAISVVIFLVVGLPIGFPFIFAYNFWKAIASSIEVTPHNFPDIYEIFNEQALKLGFEERKMPRLFLRNGNGTMNAYASRCGLAFRNYIVLYSDIVDLYSEVRDEKNEELLRFVISHELGHVKLGHTKIRRVLLQTLIRSIMLQPTFTRAQEYSADRAAASVCTQGRYAESMVALFVGKYQSKYVDVNVFCQEDAKEKSRFWLKLVNFMADHPVARRRLAALSKMDKEGWEHVYGKMF